MGKTLLVPSHEFCETKETNLKMRLTACVDPRDRTFCLNVHLSRIHSSWSC
uniref:Uncharacterized protein n=1 Tax=Arion vulgaris TaxID=1028688 RepID=A0A0B7BXY6_9EUPU